MGECVGHHAPEEDEVVWYVDTVVQSIKKRVEVFDRVVLVDGHYHLLEHHLAGP